MRDLVRDHIGTDGGKVIIDPFYLGNVPFQEADKGVTAPPVAESADRAMRTSSLMTASVS